MTKEASTAQASVEPSDLARSVSSSGSIRSLAVLYLINQYPAVTHTFIKREVLALERLGVEVIRVAARAGQGLVDPSDLEEERRTTYLLRRPLTLLQAAAWCVLLRPNRFVKALATTLRMLRNSDRGPVLHILYLLEAWRCCNGSLHACRAHSRAFRHQPCRGRAAGLAALGRILQLHSSWVR